MRSFRTHVLRGCFWGGKGGVPSFLYNISLFPPETLKLTLFTPSIFILFQKTASILWLQFSLIHWQRLEIVLATCTVDKLPCVRPLHPSFSFSISPIFLPFLLPSSATNPRSCCFCTLPLHSNKMFLSNISSLFTDWKTIVLQIKILRIVSNIIYF